MKATHSFGHLIGGIFLVAATTIGVGMLALPVATGPSGFIPSAISYLVCWLFMLCTGLLILEVSLWMPPDTSFISMAERSLGPIGRHLSWLVYLFLFVTVMVAHIAGGGPILHDLTGWEIPNWLFGTLYICVIAPVIYLGTRSVDRLNLILFSGVALSYIAFFVVSLNQIQPKLLAYSSWSKTWSAMPILFTAFTFQVIIPTLVSYLNRNVRKIRLVIFIGSFIPFLVYLLWELLILGIVPTEKLVEANQLGQNAVDPLRAVIGSSSAIFLIGKIFSFFALTTSFVPFSLAFFDFLADGLKIEKKGLRRMGLLLAVFGVPLVIALIYPHIFLIALGYAGGISCALLFGLLPPLMAWVGRYIQHSPLEFRQLPGGKVFLACLMVFALFILAGEILHLG